jgi:triosephosphate isomerase
LLNVFFAAEAAFSYFVKTAIQYKRMGKLIIANWKMNPERQSQAVKLARAVAHGARNLKKAKVVLCPPFVHLEPVSKILSPKSYRLNPILGGQDCAWENRGAHTGSISPTMLADAGARYVILGHSERRREFGETDYMIGAKAAAAIKAGLIPVICVGEWTRKGMTMSRIQAVVKGQLVAVMRGLGGVKPKKIVIAYEPVWAISTVGGGEETPDDAATMIRFIRKFLGAKPYALYPKVIYGGSVNTKNAQSFLRYPEIEGALVGAASLKAADFLRIAREGENAETMRL